MYCGYPGQNALNHFKENVWYETVSSQLLQGKVVAIKNGPVSTEVTIETAAGEKLVSSITSTSAENLGLKVGDTAYAVIKASSVMIAVD